MGTYTVTVTDANGCTVNASASVTQPSSALSSTISSSQNVNCFGGNNASTAVTAAGGTSPYTYSWNNGSTSSALSGIIAGTYTVTVTDANGCTSQSSQTITQPSSALSSSASPAQNVTCYGLSNGSINLTTAGGTSQHIFFYLTHRHTEHIVF